MLGLRVDYSGRSGRAEATLPNRVRAGDLLPWSLIVRPGRQLPQGSRIGIARRWPSDWGPPQAVDPDAPDYLDVGASSGIPLGWHSGRLSEWHPFDHVLMIELAGPLDGDARLTLEFGGRNGASPGNRVQTFAEEAAPLAVRLQAPGEASWTEIARIETEVVGGDPERLVATAPSVVAPGEPFSVHVRLEDKWGNPASDADLEASIEGFPRSRGHIRGRDGSWARLEAALDAPGLHRLRVRDAGGRFSCTTNPIRCEPGAGRLFWGDLHAQSAIGCGARSIASYFGHARDFAALDFASHQANCFLVSGPEWEETQSVTREFQRDGSFVTLLGYEWSGATPVGGDHNVYFPGDRAEIRRCSHSHLDDPSDAHSDLPHVRDLYDHLRGTDSLIVVHVGGRTSNLEWHEPTTERLLEVHSTHATSEWFLFEAFRRGYRFGVTGGSDGVDGRPGASHPGRHAVRNLRGGLTAVRMASLSRRDLWDALRSRRTYATTGERILLEFESDGHGLGESRESAGSPRFKVRVAGTAPLAAVELFRGPDRIGSAPISAEDSTPSGDVRIAWRGASAPGNWERARMDWSGRLVVEDGRIVSARGWALDSADEGPTTVTDEIVAWRSLTAGDWDGLVVSLEETPSTRLRFVSAPLTCVIRAADLALAPTVLTATGPERTVRFERLPAQKAPAEWTGELQDDGAPEGEHPYWLRVRQEDGAGAWSSPIFVTVRR